jgi:hypothetical protein
MAVLQAASTLLAGTAQAQTVACEQLKSSLAARIEATGVRGYSLEAVPADTPTPSDARVIGTCSIGAYKVLYRRWSSTQKAPAGAASDVPEPPATPARAAVPTAPPSPAVAPVPPLTGPPLTGPPLTGPPAPAPADERPQAYALHGPPAPEEPPKPDSPLPAQQSALLPGGPPGVRAVPPGPAGSAATAAPARRAFSLEFSAVQWAGALGLLLLAGGMAAWLARRSAYDSAGLPRGPRVRVRG